MPEAWLFVVVGGPLLLILVIYWARWRNRKVRNPRDIATTEIGAKKLREDIKRDPEYPPE